MSSDEQRAPMSAERLAVIRAMMSLTDLGDTQHKVIGELLADNDRLRAELAAVASDPCLQELAKAHISYVDEDDVIIKVSPGRAAWVISRVRVLLARSAATGEGEGSAG